MWTCFQGSSVVVDQTLPRSPHLPTGATIAQVLGELRRLGWSIHHILWPPQCRMLGVTATNIPQITCLAWPLWRALAGIFMEDTVPWLQTSLDAAVELPRANDSAQFRGQITLYLCGGDGGAEKASAPLRI